MELCPRIEVEKKLVLKRVPLTKWTDLIVDDSDVFPTLTGGLEYVFQKSWKDNGVSSQWTNKTDIFCTRFEVPSS